MRTPSMTAREAEGLLGVRGRLAVTSGNRAVVRKWLVANGLPAGFVSGLSLTRLADAYNDVSDGTLTRYKAECNNALAPVSVIDPADVSDDDDMPYDDVPPPPAPVRPNGHVNGHGSDDAAQLMTLLRRLMGSAVDEHQVRTIVASAMGDTVKAMDGRFAEAETSMLALISERLASLETTVKHEVVLKDVNGAVRELGENVHPQFATLLKAAQARGPDGHHVNILLAGEASSGKTTAARQIAKALGRDWHFNGAISMPHEMLGFVDAGGTYHGTAFRTAYEHGGVYTFDEVDRCDPVALLAVNPHLANGVAQFPDRQVTRHKDCLIICTANTWGTGGTADYVGATKLDAAFLDRFGVRIRWNIDEDFERAIADNRDWVKRVQKARATAKAAGLKVLISVRASITGAALIAAGFSPEEAAAQTYLANLTDEQRKLLA